MLEYKLRGNESQYRLMDEAIRTAQFVQNKCIRYWIEGKEAEKSVGQYDLSKHTTVLRNEFEWCKKLNSTAVQAAGERAWSAIARFYDRCKKGIKPAGYPKFQKNVRSVEFKLSGWKLDAANKRLTFTDKFGIGTLKLKGTYDLMLYPKDHIQRVRMIRRSDGYYAQFVIKTDRVLDVEPSGNSLGIDVGLKSFYTDSEGREEPSPRFLRRADPQLRRAQRRVSSKVKGSKNRRKAIGKLGRVHLKVQRQRKDHAIKLARCVMMSNDFVAIEDLRVKNMVKNHSLAKSINDASWTQFRHWLEYFGKVMGKVIVAVNPAYTSQMCSKCGQIIKKDLKQREHVCGCGLHLDRDHNAAINILKAGLRTAGHVGTVVAIPESLAETVEDPKLTFGATV